jgi:hypothetical protein
MARDHLSSTPPSEPAATVATEEPEPRELFLSRPAAQIEPHAIRFRIVYALLAVVLGATVGGFIVLLGRGDSVGRATWSAWEPQGSAFSKTDDIAGFVGRRYRLASGKQLVAVIPRIPPAIQTSPQEVPIAHIALAESNAQEDIEVFSAQNSVEYILCGVGAEGGRCAIGEGKATGERARLLHRESLELALYTFKYVDGVDSVVTLQPPRAGQNPSFATFFRKDDFEDQLDQPLATTLRGQGPFSADSFPIVQQTQIARLVSPYVFRYTYQQAPDGSAVMVLQPFAA